MGHGDRLLRLGHRLTLNRGGDNPSPNHFLEQGLIIMPASLNTGVQAKDLGYNVVQALRKRITFLDAGTTVTVGSFPPAPR